jgi:S-adenosylmethionine:tRNA-ribosyltransferase-isomerase (queuine synthetase)
MFKVGDKVKRIQNEDYTVWLVEIGPDSDPTCVYTVDKISTDIDGTQTILIANGYWAARNFELVESTKETKMISLKDNKTALINLKLTINEIENLDQLIEHYKKVPGPAYVEMRHVKCGTVDVQIDRKIMLVALKEQRQKLVDYMATLGIDANN